MAAVENKLRIAVIKTDGIGDAVLAFPFLFELRKNFPYAHIAGFLSPAGAQVLGGLDVFDEIKDHEAKWLSYRKTFFAARWLSALSLLLKINQGNFDIVIGLRWQDRLTSLILSLCSAKDKYGYDTGGMGFFINHKIPVLPAGTHVVERNMEVLRRMLPGRTFRIRPRLAYCALPAGIRAEKKYAVLHPVSGCPAKDWPAEKYGALAAMLAKKMPVYIIGSPADKAAAAISGKNIVNLTGRLSICEMSGLIRNSGLVIGNDSAAVHMAAANGVRSLTLFSGTADHREWGAYGKESYIITADAQCKNCGLAECEKSSSCCMDFGVDRVYSLALDIIRGKQRKNIVIQ